MANFTCGKMVRRSNNAWFGSNIRRSRFFRLIMNQYINDYNERCLCRNVNKYLGRNTVFLTNMKHIGLRLLRIKIVRSGYFSMRTIRNNVNRRNRFLLRPRLLATINARNMHFQRFTRFYFQYNSNQRCDRRGRSCSSCMS